MFTRGFSYVLVNDTAHQPATWGSPSVPAFYLPSPAVYPGFPQCIDKSLWFHIPSIYIYVYIYIYIYTHTHTHTHGVGKSRFTIVSM